MLQTWPGWADKNFQGGTKKFSTIVEKFYPRIKIFWGTIFFLTVPGGIEKRLRLVESCLIETFILFMAINSKQQLVAAKTFDDFA